jgi:AraC-like DNA-binding protein
MTSEAELPGAILHRVLPDGCADIIFDPNARSYAEGCLIVGTMTRPILAELTGRLRYVAVRFQPAGFLHFFDGQMSDLTDRILPLEMISGRKVCNPIEQLGAESDLENQVKLLERYLSGLLRPHTGDPVMRIALQNILRTGGNLGIFELSKLAGISERQLRRKFLRWTGISPKIFCRIIRFRSFLRSVRNSPRCTLLHVALDCGYYDQAHFIHEFNSFCGLSPSDYLKTKIF